MIYYIYSRYTHPHHRELVAGSQMRPELQLTDLEPPVQLFSEQELKSAYALLSSGHEQVAGLGFVAKKELARSPRSSSWSSSRRGIAA